MKRRLLITTLVILIALSIPGTAFAQDYYFSRFPRETDMAATLGMSDRTLRRRLQERNTAYQTILDEVRAELALGYLNSTSLSADEIAGLLGFTEITAFRRAFKKWHGRNVGEVRKVCGVARGGCPKLHLAGVRHA